MESATQTPHMALKNNMKNSPKVVGILLIYYQPYVAEATQYFTELLQSISKNFVLVIVKNQDLELPLSVQHHQHVINGDNTLREFSGWQAGIEYCESQQLMPLNGIVIFANDTFCHHNKFGPITRWAFRRSFRKILKSPTRMSLVGEVHPTGSEFTIGTKIFSKWVSTYVFAMTVPLLKRVGSLVPPLNLDQFFTGQLTPDKFLTGPLSENLKQHLVSYLFGLRGSAKWYAASLPTKENSRNFIGKTQSILCEMHMSATVVGIGAEMTSVFNSKLLFQARRLERLLPRHRQNSAGRP